MVRCDSFFYKSRSVGVVWCGVTAISNGSVLVFFGVVKIRNSHLLVINQYPRVVRERAY